MAFGNRFLEKRSVQIAMMGGDYDKCIAWAIKVGLEKGVPPGSHRSAPGR